MSIPRIQIGISRVTLFHVRGAVGTRTCGSSGAGTVSRRSTIIRPLWGRKRAAAVLQPYGSSGAGSGQRRRAATMPSLWSRNDLPGGATTVRLLESRSDSPRGSTTIRLLGAGPIHRAVLNDIVREECDAAPNRSNLPSPLDLI